MESKKEDIELKEGYHILASSGYIFPRTEEEIDSFDKLYSETNFELKDYKVDPDKLIRNCSLQIVDNSTKFCFDTKKNTYFKRIVLAAEIVSQLHLEPTFGHVKLQKLMFLCENIKGMNINFQYSKKAAGPFDNKFMHSIDAELERQNWFKVSKEKCGSITRYIFTPLKNSNGHKTYFEHYFSHYQESIQWFIDTFRKERTDKVELIATLFACWQELLKKNQLVNESSLLALLYSWSVEKKKFSEESAHKAIQWMRENNIVPIS